MVEAMTDNRNMTASEVRHHFDKYGGKLGAAGCVARSFDRKGVIVIDNEDGAYDEDTVLSDALEAGDDDLLTDEDVYEIYTSVDGFNEVAAALEKKKYKFLSAQLEMVPSNYINLTNPEDSANMEKLLEHLEDSDDVQNVWHNWEKE